MRAAQMRYHRSQYGKGICISLSLPKKRSKEEFKDNLDQIRYVKYISGVIALDIITQEANVKCVRMPFCGHPMNEHSLYEFALHQFKNKERVIQCPHSQCAQVFAYPVIKKILQSKPKYHQVEHV